MVYIALFAIMLLVQIGASYYLSFATLLLVVVVAKWADTIGSGSRGAAPLSLLALCMLAPLLFEISWSPMADALRIGREAAMFVLLASALIGMRTAPMKLDEPSLVVLAGFAGLILLITIVQSYGYSRGIYYGVPAEYFAQETGTIAGALDLMYGVDYLRPSATFAEPSYLGFILLSVALMLVPRLDQPRAAGAVLAMIVASGLLSRSLAFLFAMLAVIVLPLALRGRQHRGLIIGGTIGIGAIVAFFTNAGQVFARLLTTTSDIQTDTSTLARVTAPIEVLVPYWQAYMFGVPFSTVEAALRPFMPMGLVPTDILHNAMFNMIFLYGIVGVALIVAILLLAKDLHARLYLLTCTFFNGAFLAVDKVAVILFALAVYETGRRAAFLRQPMLAAIRQGPQPIRKLNSPIAPGA